MEQARAALRDVAPRLVTLVRNIPDPGASSIGGWTAADVAAHLSHAFRVDIDAVAGRPVPRATVTRAGMGEATGKLLAEDGERDPSALADRIAALAEEFDIAASRSGENAVDWLQGTRLPSSVVACHLLQESLVHGLDIARAAGRPWPVRRDHGRIAFEGGGLQLVAALPPSAFLDQEKARSFRARFDLRLRGGGSMALVFDRGSLTLGAPGGRDVDAHISADPFALLLMLFRRQGPAKPILGGNLIAWGRRPWKIPRMIAVMNLP